MVACRDCHADDMRAELQFHSLEELRVAELQPAHHRLVIFPPGVDWPAAVALIKAVQANDHHAAQGHGQRMTFGVAVNSLLSVAMGAIEAVAQHKHQPVLETTVELAALAAREV